MKSVSLWAMEPLFRKNKVRLKVRGQQTFLTGLKILFISCLTKKTLFYKTEENEINIICLPENRTTKWLESFIAQRIEANSCKPKAAPMYKQM